MSTMLNNSTWRQKVNKAFVNLARRRGLLGRGDVLAINQIACDVSIQVGLSEWMNLLVVRFDHHQSRSKMFHYNIIY